MTHKEIITELCTKYGENQKARFIGYNTAHGSRMYGTLSRVAEARCIEAPVAENLMMGLAMGMSLEGYLPVVCFERHDFLLLALDALVNHVDKLPYISGGQFKFPIVIRAIVGAKNPLNPGPQHTQDYTYALDGMLNHTSIVVPKTVHEYRRAWEQVGFSPSGAVVIVEYKDLYDVEISER